MNKKKILIVGSDGQLAFDLIRTLKQDYEVIEARHSDFDITDFQAARDFIRAKNPDIVLNTAAYNKTEEAERDPEKSFRVNAIGAYHLALSAARVGAGIFYFSTNYVFDGTKDEFSEDDYPHPVNVYGASKYAGENLTALANENAYIVRTSMLFGIHQSGKGYNFVSLMQEKAKNGEEIRVVDDQFGSPTYAYDLASKVKELIDRNARPGIYHIANSGSCSWYEFAQRIFALSGVHPVALIPVSTADSGSTIKRPHNTTLVSKNLSAVGIAPLRVWDSALAVYLDELRDK